MRIKKKLLTAVLILTAALAVTLPGLAAATEEIKTLDILFVHDIHSDVFELFQVYHHL